MNEEKNTTAKALTSTMTAINGTALLKAFNDRNLSYSDIAEQFGYSRSYFSSCARQGTMRTSLCELLWNEYNIPMTEYAAGSDIIYKAVSDNVKTPARSSANYDVIYKAVCDAINDSQGGLYAAFYGAFKKCLKEYNEGRI